MKQAFAQAYKREDGLYGWRFYIDGNIRAVGTDPKDTLEEAIEDFEEVIEYTKETDNEV